MASRSQLLPIPQTRTVTPDDINAIYAILNGSYGARNVDRGLGMSVKLTGYDGRLAVGPNGQTGATGLINTTDYALEVRNRETTQQRTFAARRADNKVVFEVRGGLTYAVIDTLAGTSPTQVMAFGQPAGGVLSGTYPNPSFPISTEYYRVYPTMVVAWYGSATTTLIAGNQELTNAPGWVLCNGASVTMRDGSVVVTPNMTDRFPLGAGGTHAKGATFGNSLAAIGAVATAHTHTGAAHTHDIGHTHQYPHVHDIGHTHDIHGHVHYTDHSHQYSHSHSLLGHTHTDGGHSHTLASHTHSMQGHTHSSTIALNTGGPSPVNGLATAGGVNLPQADHTHTVNSTFTSGGPNAPNASTAGPSSNSTDSQSFSSTGGASANATDAQTIDTTGGMNTPTYPQPPGYTDVTASNPQNITHTGNTPALGSATTGGNSNANTGAAAFSAQTGSAGPTVNTTPPGLAWYWIMKL